jgi:tetratricopeptide (TPR) repeat protein
MQRRHHGSVRSQGNAHGVHREHAHGESARNLRAAERATPPRAEDTVHGEAFALPVYRPSGRVGAKAWLVAALRGLPAAVAGGWVAAWWHDWMPGFVGGAIGALGAAFLAFVGLGMVADTTHARHRAALTAMGAVLMAVWLSSRWAFTLGAWQGGVWVASATALDAQWQWGPILGALAEAVFVGGMGVLSFRTQADTPYSEEALAWARQSFKGELWCTQDQTALLADLRQRGVMHLLDMPRAMDLQVTPAGSSWQTLQLTGMWVEREPTARWVTLRQVTHTRDERGKVQSDAQNWLQHWHVNADAYRALSRHLAESPVGSARVHEAGVRDASGEGHPGGPLRQADSVDGAAPPPTPDELVPALAAFEAGQHGAALQLAQAQRSHPDAAVQADALRLCGLASSRLSRWAEAFGHFHALFELEPQTLNALQLATTSVMAGELLRGQAWYQRACALNQTQHEMPPARLCTHFISALEQAGEHEAALPLLDELAQQYRAHGITDSHFLWSRGLPFLEEFLRKSWALQVGFQPAAVLRPWYQDLAADLDESGQQAVSRFLAEVDHHAAAR